MKTVYYQLLFTIIIIIQYLLERNYSWIKHSGFLVLVLPFTYQQPILLSKEYWVLLRIEALR